MTSSSGCRGAGAAPSVRACAAQRCRAASRSRSRARSARGSKASFRRSTAAAAIRRAPSRSSGTKTPPTSSRPSSTATLAQARQAGLRRARLLLLFGGQPPQCGPLNNQIQQMRANLDTHPGRPAAAAAATRARARRRSAAPSWRRSRRTIAARNTGRRARSRSARRLVRILFGAELDLHAGSDDVRQHVGGTYPHRVRAHLRRLLYPDLVLRPRRPSSATTNRPASACARPPRSRSTRTAIPARTSPRRCRHAASPTPRCRTRSATAQAFDSVCSCQRPGETWAQALKHLDDQTVEHGDIVVTEERARQMSQPRVDAQGKPIRPEPRNARPDPRAPQRPAAAPAAR